MSDKVIPPLTGPSEYALSISVTATPDSLTQDGASQSSILVVTRDANGRPVAAVPFRLDMIVGGQIQDYGRLNGRTIVTGTDGRASSVYTAPPAPPANLGGAGSVVTILAAPTGTNFQAVQPQTVDIRLVPPGVIIAPADTPTARFTVSPAIPRAKMTVSFDASSSCPGLPAGTTGCEPSSSASLTNYLWDFGDNTQGAGRFVTHVYQTSGLFNVSLTVVNDRGIKSDPTTVTVTVDPADGPASHFSFSPSTPGVKQNVNFDGSSSTAGEGHRLVSYQWTFGDGATGTGVSATHAYQLPGIYNVQLTVTDEVGQSNTTPAPGTQVFVTATAPSVQFQVSPASPEVGQDTVFDASQVQAGIGHTITSYSWNFGDRATATGVVVHHTFSSQGTFNVTLTVTDEIGQVSTGSRSVSVASVPRPIAAFTFSPASPAVNDRVFFNGQASTAAQGHSIVSYAWTFGDGGSGGGDLVQHQYDNARDYAVVLTVTDDAGQTATQTQTVTVGGGGTLQAKFTSSPAGPAVGQDVIFDARTSTAAPGQTIVDYAWNFGDSTPIVHTSDPVIAHAYSAVFNYTVNLVVTDRAGRKASTTGQVNVGAIVTPSPTADFSWPDPQSPTHPVSVTFNAASSKSSTITGAPIAQYVWTFSDGAQGSPAATFISHVYNFAGTFTVSLTVIDTLGNSNSITRTIIIQ